MTTHAAADQSAAFAAAMADPWVAEMMTRAVDGEPGLAGIVADYLEEEDRQYPQPEYAEFIRNACELPATRVHPNGHAVEEGGRWKIDEKMLCARTDCRNCFLRRRQTALLTRHARRWVPDDALWPVVSEACPCKDGQVYIAGEVGGRYVTKKDMATCPRCNGHARTPIPSLWSPHNGILTAVRVPEIWQVVGGPCERCHGSRVDPDEQWREESGSRLKCRSCRGTAPLLPALRTLRTLRFVWCADREPWYNPDNMRFLWLRDNDVLRPTDAKDRLPQAIFDIVQPNKHRVTVDYPTREAAALSLARATAAWVMGTSGRTRQGSGRGPTAVG